jgi:hypothetical protein
MLEKSHLIIAPLHKLSRRSDFDFEFAETFVIENLRKLEAKIAIGCVRDLQYSETVYAKKRKKPVHCHFPFKENKYYSTQPVSPPIYRSSANSDKIYL